MNLNKGCIEIVKAGKNVTIQTEMNLNKGCIEILQYSGFWSLSNLMNLNKGCIEIDLAVFFNSTILLDEP